MLVYPHLAHHVLPTSEQVGVFLGIGIHDTSQVLREWESVKSEKAIGASAPLTFEGYRCVWLPQVMGAAVTYAEVYDDEIALKVAAVTKLTRNLFLAGYACSEFACVSSS